MSNLKQITLSVLNDLLNKMNLLKRLPAKVVEAENSEGKVRVQLVHMPDTILSLYNKTNEILTIGDSVWIYYWTKPSSGYVAVRNGEVNSILNKYPNAFTNTNSKESYRDEESKDYTLNNVFKVALGELRSIGYHNGYSVRRDYHDTNSKNGTNRIVTGGKFSDSQFENNFGGYIRIEPYSFFSSPDEEDWHISFRVIVHDNQSNTDVIGKFGDAIEKNNSISFDAVNTMDSFTITIPHNIGISNCEFHYAFHPIAAKEPVVIMSNNGLDSFYFYGTTTDNTYNVSGNENNVGNYYFVVELFNTENNEKIYQHIYTIRLFNETKPVNDEAERWYIVNPITVISVKPTEVFA